MTSPASETSDVKPVVIRGSELYERAMSRFEEGGKRDKLIHTVWDGTPWMVNAYTGSIDNFGRYREVMEWCKEHFGSEARPIQGKHGDWRCGGATVMGWTWLGFRTEEMMNKFIAAWPKPDSV